MTWNEVGEKYATLSQACFSGAAMGQPWRAYAETVRATHDKVPPYHLKTLFSVLPKVGSGRRPADIRILEHGCGSGKTLLYLLALGYSGIHGVDVGGPCEKWNRLLREQFSINERRFFTYDGATIPLADSSVDLVFSQQVLEHVAPEAIDPFYREEGRVLRPGGIAYHEVPHRLGPYDSHSQTWFIHYVPHALQAPLYGLCGCDPGYLGKMLFLRSPGFHRRQVRRHIGTCEDITLARLARPVDPSYYDGPVRLRNLIRAAVTAPVFGPAMGHVLKNLVMIETVSVKR